MKELTFTVTIRLDADTTFPEVWASIIKSKLDDALATADVVSVVPSRRRSRNYSHEASVRSSNNQE